MSLNKKTIVATLVTLAGTAALALAPVSQAHEGYPNHGGWEPTHKRVIHKGCRRIIIERVCRFHHGYKECYREQRVKRVC